MPPDILLTNGHIKGNVLLWYCGKNYVTLGNTLPLMQKWHKTKRITKEEYYSFLNKRSVSFVTNFSFLSNRNIST